MLGIWISGGFGLHTNGLSLSAEIILAWYGSRCSHGSPRLRVLQTCDREAEPALLCCMVAAALQDEGWVWKMTGEKHGVTGGGHRHVDLRRLYRAGRAGRRAPLHGAGRVSVLGLSIRVSPCLHRAGHAGQRAPLHGAGRHFFGESWLKISSPAVSLPLANP